MLHFAFAFAISGLVHPAHLGRRGIIHSVTAAAASATFFPQAAQALNIELTVSEIDRAATKRTPADFSSVLEIRPISGPLGVGNGLVILDAGNAGDFDYVWLRNEKTGKVIKATSKAAPPGPLKVNAARGSFVRPLAYSKSSGLYEGDIFEVLVGEFIPDVVYEGRPNGPIGISGKALYSR